MVVADTLNCQRETAEAIIRGKGDYLLDAKGDQAVLKQEIRGCVQDENLRKTINCKFITEKSRDRKLDCLHYDKCRLTFWERKWKNLCCVGASKIKFERKGIKQKNGVIIFPAAIFRLRLCFITSGWSGLLKRCIGFLTFILRRITAAL